MKKRAYILPLEGKYYGTEIDVGDTGLIEIWGVDKTGEPSQRELDTWGDEEGDICDSHYEDAGDLKVASVIVKALNEYFEGKA